MSVIRKASMFAAVILGACVSSAHAQEIVTAKVPFAFVAAGRTLPAGRYQFRSVDGGGAAIAIQGLDDESASAFVLSSNASGDDPAGDQPSLVFTRYENQYRLTEIWDSRTEGRALPDFSPRQHEARAGTQGGLLTAQQFVLASNWK